MTFRKTNFGSNLERLALCRAFKVLKPRVDVRATVEQRLDALDVAGRRRHDGAEQRRRQSVPVKQVGVGSVTQQGLNCY